MATKVGDAFVEMSAKDTQLVKDLGNAQGKVNKSADAMAKKLAGIGKGMAIAGAAITAALGVIIKKTAEAGDKFDKMSLRTGISVEALSSLAYAADISGTSIETMEKGLKGLTMSMNDMSMGMGEAKDAYEKLGVAVVDTDGNLRPTIDVFKEIATRITEIENPTLQASLAMDIFGGRAGPQLLPLLKQGEKGIDELMNKAKELGITMTTEAATAAAEFTDRMTDLRGSLAGAGRMIGDTLIPVLTPLIEKVVEIVGKVKEWAEENKPLMEIIVKWGGAIGVLMLGLGPLLMMLPGLVAAFTLLGPAIAVLTGPIGLVIAAVALLVLAWKNWDKIVKFVKDFKDKIIKFIIDLKDKVSKKIKPLIDFVEDSFGRLKKVINFVKDFVRKIIAFFVDLKDKILGKIEPMIDFIFAGFERLNKLIDIVKGWGKKISEALGSGISKGNPRIEKAMNEVVETVAKPIRSRSPIEYGELRNLHKWGKNISEELAGGIIDGIPEIETAGDELAIAFKDKMLMLHTDVITETEDMMDDIKTAIEDKTPDIITPTQTFADSFLKIFTTLKTDFKTNIIDPIVGYLTDNLANAIEGILTGVSEIEWSWKSFWEGLKNILIKAVSAMIAKLIILAGLSWLFPWLIPFLSLSKGGGITGYEKGGKVKDYQAGGDVVPAMLTPGEYVISKPMVDFIKRTGTITGDLIDAVRTGARTSIASFAGGGNVSNPISNTININAGAIIINTPKFGESDAQEMFRLIERQAKMRGLAFGRA